MAQNLPIILALSVAVMGLIVLGGLLSFVWNARRRADRDLVTAREEIERLRNGTVRLEAENKALSDGQAQIRQMLEAREAELAQLREREGAARTRLAEVETAHLKDAQAQQEKIRELTAVREGIEKDLKILTDTLLKENTEAFLNRAKETFEAETKANREGMEGLVKPVKEALKTYHEKLSAAEEARKKDEGALSQQVQHLFQSNEKLRDTASNLVNALQSAPKTRGRWGEQQLKTVLEMAGMTEHIDFETEVHIATEGRPLRPDVILRLPGDRRIVIDAKTPMAAYLDAVNAPSEEGRERLLQDHVRQLRTHAQQLGGKAYWDALPQAPDFVVMFVPGDNLYVAAIERDPGLFDFAYDRKVIIATPTTFLALAKAVAFGWRQEQASQDARQVLEQGTLLYKRVKTLIDHLSGLSRALNTTVKKHNELVGSLQQRVLPAARTMHRLGVGNADGTLEPADVVETQVRQLTMGEMDEDGPTENPGGDRPSDREREAS